MLYISQITENLSLMPLKSVFMTNSCAANDDKLIIIDEKLVIITVLGFQWYNNSTTITEAEYRSELELTEDIL